MVSEYKNALRKLWTGRCTVFVLEQKVNEQNGRSEPVEIVTLRDEPCRLSYKSIPSASQNSEATAVTQAIKLFLSKEIKIPEGSKIEVVQEGVTALYEKSGAAAVYSNHQEITLELFKEWA